MKIKKFIFYAVWIILIAVLQPTLFSALKIFGIAPDIFLVFVVATAFLRGKTEGAVCGAVCGLVFDFLAGRLIGVNALIFMYAGFCVGMIKERYISGAGAITVGVITAIVSLVCSFVYYIAYSMVSGDIGFFAALIRIILPGAIYTAIAGVVLFIPIEKSFKLIENRRMII